MTYTITYYKNRKLYSHDASRYVNLRECKDLIDAGHSIRFLEHGTERDVTEHCLKEMLCKFAVSSESLIKLLKKKD